MLGRDLSSSSSSLLALLNNKTDVFSLVMGRRCCWLEQICRRVGEKAKHVSHRTVKVRDSRSMHRRGDNIIGIIMLLLVDIGKIKFNYVM